MTTLPDVRESVRGAEVVGASPELLHSLLQVLEDELDARGVPRELSPGADRDSIRVGFESTGLKLPIELEVLFSWHDGHPLSGPEVIPRFPFDSFEGDLEAYRRVISVFEGMAQADGLSPDQTEDFDWGAGAGWLRLWRDNYTWAVDCSLEPEAPPLVRATGEDFRFAAPPSRQVVSLCTPVVWIIEGLRSDAHVWIPESQSWQLNAERLPALQRKYGFV
jgi:hypothetical protein